MDFSGNFGGGLGGNSLIGYLTNLVGQHISNGMDLHSWLSSLGGSPSGFNPTQGTGLGFAPALGPGGTGAGTGSGVGAFPPNTPTPSVAELTGAPLGPAQPAVPYAYGGEAPGSTGVPEAAPSPTSGGAYVPPGEPGGDLSSWLSSLGHGSGVSQNLRSFPQQWIAMHAGLGPGADQATSAALQRAAAYRAALLGS